MNGMLDELAATMPHLKFLRMQVGRKAAALYTVLCLMVIPTLLTNYVSVCCCCGTVGVVQRDRGGQGGAAHPHPIQVGAYLDIPLSLSPSLVASLTILFFCTGLERRSTPWRGSWWTSASTSPCRTSPG